MRGATLAASTFVVLLAVASYHAIHALFAPAGASIINKNGNTMAAGRHFSPSELSAFAGIPKGTPIYVAILGDVFDVTSGRRFYGSGKGYAHFAARDASRAFATGETEGDGLTDAVDGLDWDDLEGIEHWHGFYLNHTNYTWVGRVTGRHYDDSGVALNAFPFAVLAEVRASRENRKQMLPECNSKWSQSEGSEVWCTTKSGGVAREWIGVPRLYRPSLDPSVQPQGTERERCVCVKPEEAGRTLPHLELYSGCEAKATACKVLSKQHS